MQYVADGRRGSTSYIAADIDVDRLALSQRRRHALVDHLVSRVQMMHLYLCIMHIMHIMHKCAGASIDSTLCTMWHKHTCDHRYGVL